MADYLYVLLRIVHVGSAVFLIGGATMWGAIMMPTLAQLGPTLPKGAMPTLGKKVLNVLPHTAVLTLLSGIAVFWSLGGFGPAMSTPWGMLVSLALLLTLVMLAISFAVLKPTFKALSQSMMATQGPPSAEAQGLMTKMTTFSKLNLGIGWLIVLLMVLASSHAV